MIEPTERGFALTNCPSSIPMTPYFFAVFLIEVRSLVEVAAVNCLYVRRRERERGGGSVSSNHSSGVVEPMTCLVLRYETGES